MPWTLVSMYCVGCSIEGTMSPMPAKWKTYCASAKIGESGSSCRMSLPVAGEIRIALEMIEIAAMTADQIVDDADRKARAKQSIDHVAADEAGSAGNDRNGLAAAHAALSLFSRRTL